MVIVGNGLTDTAHACGDMELSDRLAVYLRYPPRDDFRIRMDSPCQLFRPVSRCGFWERDKHQPWHRHPDHSLCGLHRSRGHLFCQPCGISAFVRTFVLHIRGSLWDMRLLLPPTAHPAEAKFGSVLWLGNSTYDL